MKDYTKYQDTYVATITIPPVFAHECKSESFDKSCIHYTKEFPSCETLACRTVFLKYVDDLGSATCTYTVYATVDCLFVVEMISLARKTMKHSHLNIALQ